MGLLIPLLLFLATTAPCFAPPLPTRSQVAQPDPPEPSANDFPAAEATPVPTSPESQPEEEIRKPTPEKVRRATLPAALTPAIHGRTEGPYLIGQRTIVEDYCGWGWVRKEGESWNQGRWIAIEYDPKV